MYKLLVLSIASPIKIGIYSEDYILVDSFYGEGYASDVLPILYKKIAKQYAIDEIFYINGPGSFMAIKICYVFLKTISIIKNIDFFGVDGFLFNKNSQIKAIGNKVFLKNVNNEIIITDRQNDLFEEFLIPQTLEKNKFTKNSLPQYILPAV